MGVVFLFNDRSTEVMIAQRAFANESLILINFGVYIIFINYYDLEKKLGGKGASEKTAKFIFKAIKT